jgi:hypothetical protein
MLWSWKCPKETCWEIGGPPLCKNPTTHHLEAIALLSALLWVVHPLHLTSPALHHVNVSVIWWYSEIPWENETDAVSSCQHDTPFLFKLDDQSFQLLPNMDNSDCKIYPISSLMDSKAPWCNLRWVLTLQQDYLEFWLLLTLQKLAVTKTVTMNPNCYTIGVMHGRLKPPGNDLASSLSWSYREGLILAELPTPQHCRGGISHKSLQNTTLGLHLNWTGNPGFTCREVRWAVSACSRVLTVSIGVVAKADVPPATMPPEAWTNTTSAWLGGCFSLPVP